MTKVKQYNWDTLRPKTVVTIPKVKHKTLKVNKPTKRKKAKAIDPSIRNYHDKALFGFYKNL